MTGDRGARILVIDDNRAIHEDFQRILTPAEASASYASARAELLGLVERDQSRGPTLRLDCADSGEHGLAMVGEALAAGDPYSVAFVDMRMPSGWDGVETIEHLWAVQPGLEVVVCTAFSDHNWREVVARLGRRDNLLVLRKPFDAVEIERMADALVRKAELARQAESRIASLAEAVAASEARFSRAFAHSPTGIALVSRDGTWLSLNPAMRDLLGLAGDDPAALPSYLETTHPDDRETCQAAARRLARGEADAARHDKRFVRPDGAVVWVEESAALVPAIGHEAPHFVIQVADRTAERAALHALEQKRARLAGIINSSSDGILTLDAAGMVRGANPAALTMFGLPLESIIWRRLTDLAQVELPARGVPLDLAVLARAGELAGTGHRADVIFPLRLRVAALPSGIDPAAAYTVFVRDLSAEVEAERMRSSLETQLRQAQKMEAIGQLAGGIAHDFNNLLSVILGGTSLLGSDERLEPEHREVVGEIATSADRAAAMTRQLLTFSRQQVTRPEVLALPDFVAEMQPMLTRLLGERVKLQIAHAGGPATVRVDRGQLTQVILNLAVNARDAMPDGGTLTLRTAGAQPAPAGAAHPEGTWASLAVEDTGQGIAPVTLERIFEPFFTTKGVGQGTGLGLAVVHGIVAEAGGTMAVASTVEVGTTMTAWFPEVRGEAAAADREPAPAPCHGEVHLLLVEDEELIGIMAMRILRRAGYAVTLAPSAEAALERLEEAPTRYAAVISDVVMPGLSGVELHDMLRRRFPHVRVIFTSGYAPEGLGIAARLAGGAHFLPKPYTAADLTHVIQLALQAPTAAAG